MNPDPGLSHLPMAIALRPDQAALFVHIITTLRDRGQPINHDTFASDCLAFCLDLLSEGLTPEMTARENLELKLANFSVITQRANTALFAVEKILLDSEALLATTRQAMTRQVPHVPGHPLEATE